MSILGTYSGKRINLEDPQPDQISIKDIARGLSRQARFAGQTKKFYSVAQHSVHVSHLCNVYLMEALLHAAAEAYLSDIPRPVKDLVPELRQVEEKLHGAIAERFGILATMPDEVANADDVLLATEFRDLCPNRWAEDVAALPAPIGLPIVPWPECQAEAGFLATFRKLDLARKGS